jgi:presenilin-like A22 family membrane protease
MNLRSMIPLISMPFMLLIVQVGAILLSPRMVDAGYAAFEDPTSVANPLIFVGILLVFTLILLYLIKKGIKRVIAIIIAASIFFAFIYIFSAVAMYFLGLTLLGLVLAICLSAGATLLLYKYPEWYVIDILGVLLAAGIASIFGISLDILPVLVLLGLLAVYDAISVYKTKHMITLAEGVLDMKTPILVIIPKKRDYSYIQDKITVHKGERDAFVMGLGDLIMPSILVVSAQVFLDSPLMGGFIAMPALGAMAGSILGLGALLYLVNKGNPQAGLPLLNGGAIAGFLIACALAGTWQWIPGM